MTSLSFIVNLITFIKDNLKDKWGNIDSNKIYAFGRKTFIYLTLNNKHFINITGICNYIIKPEYFY